MRSFTQKDAPANEIDAAPFQGGRHLAAGQEALERDSAALAHIATNLGAAFEASCELIMGCAGRVFLSGDDAAHSLGTKIAKTLNRVGISALWVGATETLEARASFATRRDLFLLLSVHAPNEFLVRLLPQLDERNVRTIGLFLQTENAIARRCTQFLSCSELEISKIASRRLTPPEHHLDALAMALLEAVTMAHNIKRPSFESQTDGRLIQRLLLKAGDLMHTDADVPTVSPFTLLPEIIAKIQTNELKMVCVVEDDGKLRGIISVKDLLVRIHQDQTNVIAQDIMQTDPVVLTVHTPLSEALTMMKHTRLEVLPVENEVGQLVGVISLHDILV